MSDLIRSSVLTGYRNVVAGLGGDPIQLLRRANIDPAGLERQDAPISFKAVIRLLEASARELDCPDFGLRMACEQDLRILGPVGIIGLNSATVGDAIAAMIEHISFYSPAVRSEIDRVSPNRLLLTYDIDLDGVIHRRQIVELAMGLYLRHMQTLSGGHFVPLAVLMRHTSPLPQVAYRRFFKCPVRLGQSVNALVVRPSDLDRPINNVDPHLRGVIAEYVKHNMSSHPMDIQKQVAYLVRRLLPEHRCTLKLVAKHMYLHQRTLQRRLAEAGVAFEDIVDAVRRERAEELLSESTLTMAQIAAQLDTQNKAPSIAPANVGLGMRRRARRRSFADRSATWLAPSVAK
jgi:AraC-like DNA-binding protein